MKLDVLLVGVRDAWRRVGDGFGVVIGMLLIIFFGCAGIEQGQEDNQCDCNDGGDGDPDQTSFGSCIQNMVSLLMRLMGRCVP